MSSPIMIGLHGMGMRISGGDMKISHAPLMRLGHEWDMGAFS